MLRLALICALIVTQIPSGRAADRKIAVKTITVELSKRSDLRQRCGPNHPDAYACTQFVGATLSAGCNAENALWSLQPKARYVALVYIAGRSLLFHEMLHVRDMERAVTEYLRDLETQRFSSDSACQTAAESAVADFWTKMRGFAGQSNASRH